MASPQSTHQKHLVKTAGVWCVATCIIALVSSILLGTIWRGSDQLSISFFVHTPEDAGRSGGIAPMLVATGLILAVTAGVALPLSFGSALALADVDTRRPTFMRIVRRCLDVLAAVPSIVFGLFGNAFFCVMCGMGYSILAGGLTLACMVLPILTRTTEQAIRAVPEEYRFGAAALGLSRTTTTLRIVFPVAAPAIGAGFVLGIGRALAETAALIFTAGYVTRMPQSLLDSGRSLSVHIYDLAMNVPGGNARANATAATLMLLFLGINVMSLTLARFATSGSRLGPEWSR